MKKSKISIALKKYYLTNHPWNYNKVDCYSQKTLDLWSEQRTGKKRPEVWETRRRNGTDKGFKVNRIAPVWNDGLDKTDPRVANNIKNWVAPLKGGHQTDSAKEKIRDYQILNPNKCRKDTSIELKIEKGLQDKNLILHKDFFKQYSVPKICIADFYYHKTNTLIFCDGDYYHANPNRYKADDIIKGTSAKSHWEHDKKQTQQLLEKGYKVLRFWEIEINTNSEYCINKILDS